MGTSGGPVSLLNTLICFIDFLLIRFVIQPHLFGALHLRHPRIMDGDLHRPEFQRRDVVADQLQPGRNIFHRLLCLTLITLLFTAHS